MFKEFQITNFKAFSKLANIPLKPITLIFGANSSGKSSIFQSLLMLKQTLENSDKPYITLFPKGNLIDLGSFKEFIYGHDINRSFSFKVTAKPHTISYGATIIDDSYLDWVMDWHPHVNLLEKSMGNDAIGLSVSFSVSPETKIIYLSYVDLYIGDDPSPVISYKRVGWDISEFTFRGNFNHKFWKRYWDIFDAKNSKDIEEVIEEFSKPPAQQAKEAIERMSEDEKKRFLEELKNTKEKKPFPEMIDSINRDLTNSDKKENVDKLIGYEQAIEAYKSIFKNHIISSEWFLPKYLNDREMKYLIDEYSYWESRDVSLYLITMGNLIKQFLKHIIYIAPLRDYPERYYIHRGNILSKYVGMTGETVPDILFIDDRLVSKVNRELNRFGYDYELRVSQLMNEESDSDEVFSLQLFNKSTGISANLRDVGFGFSQVLPIIIQSMLSKNNTLLIEQPELHLHPKLQAELGDLFINSALGDQKNKFLIETHSEHLILRILRRIRETTDGELPEGVKPITPEQVAILYVQPGKEGSEVIHIPVNEDGEFERPWPQGFFAERARELF